MAERRQIASTPGPDPDNAGVGKSSASYPNSFLSSGSSPYRRIRFMLNVVSLRKRFGDLSIFEDFDLKLPKNGFTVSFDQCRICHCSIADGEKSGCGRCALD